MDEQPGAGAVEVRPLLDQADVPAELADRAGRWPGDSYDRFVRLFTPVSAKEADRLERGVPLDEPLYWTDRPVPEEADDDAIWMVVTIPYEDLAGANEQPVHPGLGYREFELPPGLPARFPVERLGPADCLGGRFGQHR